MPHYPTHFYLGVGALAATLLIWGLTVNRLVKRKLQLSIFLLAGYVAVHLLFLVRPELGGGNTDLTSPTRPFERLGWEARELFLQGWKDLFVEEIDEIFGPVFRELALGQLLSRLGLASNRTPTRFDHRPEASFIHGGLRFA